MKKYLLILGVAALAFGVNKANAQVTYPIISASADDFNLWTDDAANQNVKDPNSGSFGVPGWQCLNPLTSILFGSSPQSCFKDSTVVHAPSTYSCRIQSVVLTATGYSYVSSFVPHDTMGILLAGTLTATPAIVPGVPFTARISSFTFWYQYSPNMNNGHPDTASCSVALTKAHSAIGGGAIKMNSTSNSWMMGTVPITYSAGGNPDTIQILFSSSSQYKPAPGSILILDGVAPLNVENVVDGQLTAINVYPNPASTELNFKVTGAMAHTVNVFDITGKKVNSYMVSNNMLTVNTSEYANGMYIYQMFDKEGSLMKVGKFNIQK